MNEHSGAVVGVTGVGVVVTGVGVVVGVTGVVGAVVGVTGIVGVDEHSEGSTSTPLKHLVPGETFIIFDHCPFPQIAK